MKKTVNKIISAALSVLMAASTSFNVFGTVYAADDTDTKFRQEMAENESVHLAFVDQQTENGKLVIKSKSKDNPDEYADLDVYEVYSDTIQNIQKQNEEKESEKLDIENPELSEPQELSESESESQEAENSEEELSSDETTSIEESRFDKSLSSLAEYLKKKEENAKEETDSNISESEDNTISEESSDVNFSEDESSDNSEKSVLLYDAYALEEKSDVIIEVTPADGYILDSLKIHSVEDENSTLSFTTEEDASRALTTMPSKDIVISATFKVKLSSSVAQKAPVVNKPLSANESEETNENLSATTEPVTDIEEEEEIDEAGISLAANQDSDASTNNNIIINSLTSSLFYGAKKESNANYVWTPTSSAAGHRIAYRVSFSTSGVGEAYPGQIKFTVPKTILKLRDGRKGDEYEMSIPSKSEADAFLNGTGDEIDEEVFLAYYEDGDNIVVYNFKELSAATDGYFEMAYYTSKSTFEYVDMAAQTPFTANMTAQSSAGTVAKQATPINVKINTTAAITSTYKKYPETGRIKEWNSSWGNECKPANSSNYYYLVWRIDSVIEATQPYTFILEDSIKGNFDGMIVVGYKFSGSSTYTKANSVSNQTISGKRYDYVLTAIPLSTYQNETYWKATNNITSIVDPADNIDEDTAKKSSAIWTWTKPEFTVPTGHFNEYKRADGAWRANENEYGSSNIYSYTTHYATSLTMKAGEYSRYDLETFNGYDNQEITQTSLDGFDYASWIVGYPYPWTYDSAYGDSKTPAAYGHKKVTYTLIDEGIYLTNDAEGEDLEKSAALTSNDFRFDSLGFSYYIRDARFDEETQSFWQTVPTFDNSDIITFYGKFGASNDWVQFATYNLKTKAISSNSTYVKSMTDSLINFNDNVDLVAYKLTTSNAKYYTELFTAPSLTLKNSGTVTNFVKNKAAIGILNNNKGIVTDSAGKEIFSKEESDSDFARVSRKDSDLTKNVVAVSNNTKKKYYTITWKVSQKETVTFGANGETESLVQESGTFYDLLPEGSILDIDSIDVSYTNQKGRGATFVDASAIQASTIQNYKGTGRTLLVVKVNQSGCNYNLFYDTVHSWDSINDYGNNVYNPIAYETGNNSIAYGFADNGGTIKSDGTANNNAIRDAELMKGLNSNSSDDNDLNTRKFIYAEKVYDIVALTSATSGLKKRVKEDSETSYSYATTTTINGKYSYQLRYMNNYQTYAKDLIFYDSLENYNIDTMATDDGSSDWHGILDSIDVEQLKAKGIAPVIYYSTISALSIDDNHDLSNTNVWQRYSDAVDKSTVKAIAIDMRKGTDGKDFVLEPGESISAYLYMNAPTQSPANESNHYLYAYNNVYLSDSIYTENDKTPVSYFIHQDYTSVKLLITGDFNLTKVSSESNTTRIAGIKFRLRGTSDYGTDYDLILTTSSNGTIEFSKIEKGSYILQEYESTSDWLLDPTEHQVIIDDNGKVFIDKIPDKIFNIGKEDAGDGPEVPGAELPGAGDDDDSGKTPPTQDGNSYVNENTIIIKNKPRIHGDLSFFKKEAGETTKFEDDFNINTLFNVKGVKFVLTGTSDYGNDIVMYAESAVNGKVTFNDIEMGTYEMKEISTNPNYVLSDISWTVVCDSFGTVSITKSKLNDQDIELANNAYYYADASRQYILNDYRYWDFSVRKIDAENNDIWLQGAEFKLTGISDFGTEYDMTATSGENGLAKFFGIEKGTYVLQETTAPHGVNADGTLGGTRNYIPDPNKYIVNITVDGKITIDGLEKEDNANVFRMKNDRSLDGTITITKVWNDNLTDDERPIPKVHISTLEPEQPGKTFPIKFYFYPPSLDPHFINDDEDCHFEVTQILSDGTTKTFHQQYDDTLDEFIYQLPIGKFRANAYGNDGLEFTVGKNGELNILNKAEAISSLKVPYLNNNSTTIIDDIQIDSNKTAFNIYFHCDIHVMLIEETTNGEFIPLNIDKNFTFVFNIYNNKGGILKQLKYTLPGNTNDFEIPISSFDSMSENYGVAATIYEYGDSNSIILSLSPDGSFYADGSNNDPGVPKNDFPTIYLVFPQNLRYTID